MTSIHQLSRELGYSRTYIRALIAKGCPTTSVQAAKKWKAEHTTGKVSGKRVSAKGELPEEPNDVEDVHPSEKRPKRTIERRKPTGDSMLDALNKALDAYDEANNLLIEAMEDGHTARISALLSIHNKALQAQFDAQRLYREEMERRKVLVNLSDAKQICRKGFDVLLRRMRALPQKMAAQVAQQEAVVALALLDREVTEIIAEAERQYGES